MTKKKQQPLNHTDFFEARFPGKLVGKEVLDKDSRRLGIIKAIRVEYLPWNVSLIIKGLNVELPVNFSEVESIGTVVILKTRISVFPEIDINNLITLREEVKEDLKDIFHEPI